MERIELIYTDRPDFFLYWQEQFVDPLDPCLSAAGSMKRFDRNGMQLLKAVAKINIEKNVPESGSFDTCK